MSQSMSPAASAWTCWSRRSHVGRPDPVAFVDGFPWPELFGQVTPPHPGPHSVQNPVDHLSVIPPPATTAVADRQERTQPFSLDIRQITPLHAHINDLGTE
jgi:hypothetical protein